MASTLFESAEPIDMSEPTETAAVSTHSSERSVGGIDLLKGVAILWSLQIALGVSLAICFLVASFTGWSAKSPFQLATSPIVFAVSTPLSFLFVWFVSWWFVCRKYGKTVRDGFAITRISRSHASLAAFVGISGAGVAGTLSHFFSTGQSFMSDLAATPFGWSAMVTLALIGPVFEEVYYRGFIYPSLRKSLGAATALALTALWFGGAHSFQLSGDWIGVPIVTSMGLVWTLQRHYSGSLTPSIISHWCYNFGILLITALTSSI